MAKKSVIARQHKREAMVAKYRAKRDELRRRTKSLTLSPAQRIEAARDLQKLPRDSSPSRLRSRCHITGRPRAVYRQFGLSRNMLRIYASEGCIPGMIKASW